MTGDYLIQVAFGLKCWLVLLEFNNPVKAIKVMSIWSVYLTILFLGRLSPLSG